MLSFIILLALLSLLVAIDCCDSTEQPVRIRASRRPAIAATLTAAALVSGCTAVPVHHQRLVSKPNMVFNDSGAFVYGPRVNAQLEPGAADNGGAVAAGCTACR